ncbi:MAG: hypothetical protein ACRDNT_06210, partial [Streptosporangiaceae bacterium]
ATALAKMVFSRETPMEPPSCWPTVTVADATPASRGATPNVPVERAQAAGQLRTHLRQTDIPFIVFLLAEATQLARGANRGSGAGT